MVAYQHAGLVAMALMIEGCHDSFKGELKNIMGLVIPLMESQNPRLMHDILMVIGYVS